MKSSSRSPEHAVRSRYAPEMAKKLATATVALLCVAPLGGCGFSSHESDTATQPSRELTSDDVYKNYSFDSDPTIIQLDPALPNPEGDRQIKPKGVSLHWWGFSADGDINKLVQEMRSNSSCGETGCSVQYAVTEDGETYRMMNASTEYAYHAGEANPTTFGVEIEGGPEDFALEGEHFNQKKFENVVSLVAELADDFDLPVEAQLVCGDVAGVHSHDEYNECSNPPGAKVDVGQSYTKAVIEAVKSTQD